MNTTGSEEKTPSGCPATGGVLSRVPRAAGARGKALLPAGPRWPGIMQLFFLFVRPTDFLQACAKKFGHTFTLRVPGLPPFVQTSDPTIIDAVFKGSTDVFQGGKANNALRPVVGHNSLLVIDGKRHHRERKLVMPMFASERVRSFGGTIRAIVTRHIDGWPVGEPFALQTRAQDLMLEIILRIVFGFEDEDTRAEFRHHVHRVLKLGVLLLPDSDGKPMAEKFVRALGKIAPPLDVFSSLRAMDALIYGQIEKRRPGDLRQGDDFLSLLLQARYDDDVPMSDQELRDELVTFLMAGHETSATIATWTVHHLSQHSEALKRLTEEIASIDGPGPPPLSAVMELGYLDAVVRETMRITPVFSLVARVLKEPVKIGDVTFPANIVLSPNIYGTHHRQDLWGDPEAFRPERFLDGKMTASQYFPFGGGTRRCTGMQLAYYELKIFVSEFVRRAKFRAAPGYRPKVVRRANTLAPSKGAPTVIDTLTG